MKLYRDFVYVQVYNRISYIDYELKLLIGRSFYIDFGEIEMIISTYTFIKFKCFSHAKYYSIPIECEYYY